MNKGLSVEEQQQITFTKKVRVYEAFKAMTEILEAECIFDDSPQFNLFVDYELYLDAVIIQFSHKIKDSYHQKILIRAVDKIFDRS